MDFSFLDRQSTNKGLKGIWIDLRYTQRKNIFSQITTENLIDNIDQHKCRFILKSIGMSLTKFMKSGIVQKSNLFS